MALDWTHEHCGPLCTDAPDCQNFPTVIDRINIASAAYEEYSDYERLLFDFALDVLLLAQSEHPADETLLPRLAEQARVQWLAHQKGESQ